MNFTEEELLLETWVNIEGYEGLYQISDLGRVKSLKTKILNRGGTYRDTQVKILKLGLDQDGYCLIGLTRDGKRVTRKVHRLVCQAFHPNPENLPLVNHKDENKANNRKDNVEWCTARYNSIYSKSKGGITSKYPGVCWKKHNKNWTSHIYINGSQKHLGSFTLEYDAGLIYEEAFKNIHLYQENLFDFREMLYKKLFIDNPKFSLIRRKRKNNIYPENTLIND